MVEVATMRDTITSETNANVTTSDGADGESEENERPRITEPPGYGFEDAFSKPIGNASSMCESCGTVVDGHDPDEWIICDLSDIDFSPESHALVCRDCRANDPNWKQNVLERRRNRHINSRLDEAIHWVSRGPVKTLFLRRAAAGIALLLTATALTSIMTAITSGLGPLWDIVASTNFAIVGGVALIGLLVGYWLHLHERERNDHRGTTVSEYNISNGPWSILVAASAGMVAGAGLTTLSMITSNVLVSLGFATYVASSVFAFRTLESAVRADRCISQVNWVPRYDRELFAMRVSVIAGVALLLGDVTIGAILPVITIGSYLFARKWHDLGPNWRLFYYGGDNNGGND